ncbi:MAG: hypothetical protein KME50_19230 [Nostoc desertorum CM1-VF14]|jgi:hypothetical protein|nr:hypothetical protein [Nostoc desertorum CM1-VF14]
MTQKAEFSRFVLAFVAGFIAVLVFHQGLLVLLHAINFAPRPPFQTTPTQPFGIPQFLSAAFWGGVWGLVWATITMGWQVNRKYWIASLIFGAVAPTLVAWFVVAPSKGLPIGGGWQPAGIITALLVNSAWGVGTALLFSWFMSRQVLNR